MKITVSVTLTTVDNAIKRGIAYLESTDTAVNNIPIGRYVFWKNGAYISTSAISAGDTLSSTNLSAVATGGFINALQTQIDALNNKIGHTTTITATTLADLKTNLLNAVNGVNSGDMLAVRISPSFSSDGFTSGATYGGYAYNIYKASGATSYFSVILSNNIGEDMFIGYSNGTWKFNSLNSKIEPIVVNSSETVASKCTRNAPIEIKPGATGTPRSGYGYIGYCSYDGTNFRHVIVSEYSTGNLFFSFGSNIGTTWYQISYTPYNP